MIGRESLGVGIRCSLKEDVAGSRRRGSISTSSSCKVGGGGEISLRGARDVGGMLFGTCSCWFCIGSSGLLQMGTQLQTILVDGDNLPQSLK